MEKSKENINHNNNTNINLEKLNLSESDKNSNKNNFSNFNNKKYTNLTKLESHENHEIHTEGGSLWKDIRTVYKFKDVIGGGHFGTVRLGYKKNVEPKKLYAIKSISKKNITDKDLDEMIKEVDILAQLDHPNIIKFYETYNDEYYFHIVMEVAKGKDVFDKIIEEGVLTEKTVAHITYKVLSALVYCHSRDISHRDIKPENILFEHESNEGEIKLIDFGLSRKYNDQEKMQTVLGTPYYVAPEVLQGSYDYKCDIWSVGAFMYIMLTGEPPFNGKNNNVIFKRILNEEVNYPSEKFKNISPDAIDLLKKCLIKDPHKRITGEQALNHKWFANEYKEVHNKNKIDPLVMNNLKSFCYPDKFQKMVLKFLVNQMEPKELEHIREVFQAMDTDHTGALNKDELIAGFKKIGMDVAKEEVEELISKIEDHDHGKVNYSEFLLAAMDFKKNVDKEKLISAFMYFDLDKTGQISLNDIDNALLRSGKKVVNKEEIKQLIKDATHGKESTKITLDEFLDMFGLKL